MSREQHHVLRVSPAYNSVKMLLISYYRSLFLHFASFSFLITCQCIENDNAIRETKPFPQGDWNISFTLFIYLLKAFHFVFMLLTRGEVYIECQSLKLFPDTRRVLKVNFLCFFFCACWKIFKFSKQ